MTSITRQAVVLALVLGVTVPAAAEFRAADLLFVPVAAHNEGVGGTLWRTDLSITNVDEVAIDLCIFYFPSGLFSNAAYLSREYGLGGRESEGWGHLDETLADIPPEGTVVLEDVVSTWLDQLAVGTSLGAMVIFAYEAGTLDQPDGRVFRNAVAHTRTYNETTIWVPDPDNPDEFVETPTTYGQGIPAVPWYNLADPSYVSDQGDFSYYVLTGGQESETSRYNVGLFNCSDAQTSVILVIQPLQSDGTAFLDDQGDILVQFVTLPPLAHVQYNRLLATTFQLEDVASVMVKVSFYSWSTTSPEPVPRFAAYGSQVDGTSGDPTAVLPSFTEPYNVECMWPADGAAAKAGGPATQARRPLEVPRRAN